MRWMPALALLVACGDPKTQPDAPTADAISDAPIDADPKNPPTLLDTGLCVDAACTQIAPGIQAYRPRWELYSDGATKKRWIYLPPGSKIDTSDMDFWKFPVGTKLWKEFTRDNVRVETRLLMRVGPGEENEDWFYVAYVWNQTQDATTAEPFGVPDANGTQHDVPKRADCRTCHDNTMPSRVLGFSALQLDFDNPDASELDLAALVANNLLTTNPPTPTNGASYPLPADASALDKTALGYLHANCGHCHNPSSKVYIDNGVLMQLRLTVGVNLFASTTTYSTTVGLDGTTSGIDNVKKILTPGMPDQSQITKRFESEDPTNRMPALGVEVVDQAALTMLREWITLIVI